MANSFKGKGYSTAHKKMKKAEKKIGSKRKAWTHPDGRIIKKR